MSSSIKRSITLRWILLLPAAFALVGCAENRYCASPEAYESAASIPAIQSVGDAKVTPTPDAYVIPPQPASAVPFGQKIPDPNKTRWSCLDQPPTLPRTATATVAPKS